MNTDTSASDYARRVINARGQGVQECIPWRGSKDKDGYGKVRWNGKTRKAHRVAYEEEYGPIPSGMFVCHHCDNPSCVNPGHLFLGTAADNKRDSVIKGRHRWTAKHGVSNPRAKLTRGQVLKIREDWANGVRPQSAIANRFGICGATVARIVSKKAWKRYE